MVFQRSIREVSEPKPASGDLDGNLYSHEELTKKWDEEDRLDRENIRQQLQQQIKTAVNEAEQDIRDSSNQVSKGAAANALGFE